MPFYHRMGAVPPKRHTQFRQPDGELYREQVMGTKGFSGMQSILYHHHAPSAITDARLVSACKPDYETQGALRHRHIRTNRLDGHGDAVGGRQYVLGNDDVLIGVASVTAAMDYFYRNGDGDELLFVHEGTGRIETMFGVLRYRPGDYVVLPIGTIYRVVPDVGAGDEDAAAQNGAAAAGDAAGGAGGDSDGGYGSDSGIGAASDATSGSTSSAMSSRSGSMSSTISGAATGKDSATGRDNATGKDANRAGRSKFLVVETNSWITTPKRYRNEHGQLLEHSPFCERDIRVPERLETFTETGAHEVRVRKSGHLHAHLLPHHPLDVVGWDGYLYPWIFNIHDFEPITGRVHMPPPIHQTFEGERFVICSFCPRMYDYHPLSIPAPYYHSNVDSDEVLYYVKGRFGSRKGIEEGSITLHPAGIPHGPHPGKAEASIGKKETDELAVMIDTFRPLRVVERVKAAEDPDYAYSWAPRPDDSGPSGQ